MFKISDLVRVRQEPEILYSVFISIRPGEYLLLQVGNEASNPKIVVESKLVKETEVLKLLYG